jgi:DNA-binding NarL/FixJ family response regulator
LPTVLIAVPPEHRQHLERSVFWRADMQRTFSTAAEVVAVARTLGPDLIIVMAGSGNDDVRASLREIRAESLTRDTVVVVIVTGEPANTHDLEQEGASLVLPHDFNEAELETPWAERMESLLRLRRRRETRVPAGFDVDLWMNEGGRRQIKGRAMNLSSRGILVSTEASLPLGSRIDVGFQAADALPAVVAVGEVVRTAQADDRWLAGVHFIVIRKEARLAIRDTLRALRGEEPGAPGDGA